MSLRNSGQLIAALAYIDGDIAMAAGNADRAIFRLDRAARAAREHAPHLVAEILATKAAGLRMRDIRSLELAVEAYDEAGAWVAQASTEQGQARPTAWITRSRSTPYAILGDWTRAAEAIEQAGETCADLDAEPKGSFYRPAFCLASRAPKASNVQLTLSNAPPSSRRHALRGSRVGCPGTKQP